MANSNNCACTDKENVCSLKNNIVKQVVLFDHEFGFKKPELVIDQDYFDEADGSSMGYIFDYYENENQNGKHNWFLEQLNQDYKQIVATTMRIFTVAGTQKDFIDSNIDKISMNSLKGDGLGNYMFSFDLPTNNLKAFKSAVRKIEDYEWGQM